MKVTKNQLPQIDRVGEFPLLNPVHDFTYRNRTNTIHFYNYSGVLKIDGREYEFTPGDISCIQAGTLYSYSSSSPGKHWCVHFYDNPGSTGDAVEIPEFIPAGIDSLFLLEQIKHTSNLFNSAEADGPTDLMILEAQHRLKALIISIHILANSRQTHKRSNRSFVWDTLMNWINENLDQPVSTCILAEKVNISANTLSQKFKKQYNTTISQYVLHKRIDKAKSLLATTSLTIYEVGVEVGIKDPQYFNKQFRRIAGISPSRYRDENQSYLSTIPLRLATLDGQWKP